MDRKQGGSRRGNCEGCASSRGAPSIRAEQRMLLTPPGGAYSSTYRASWWRGVGVGCGSGAIEHRAEEA